MLVLNEGGDRPITEQPDTRRERIKHLLIGSRRVVKATIATLHTKRVRRGQRMV